MVDLELLRLRRRSMAKKIRHKFRAKPKYVDDKYFPSTLEADYYEALKERVNDGEVLFFLRQVPIDLPGEVRYVLDFLEFHPDGTVHFVDTKGHETANFKTKRRIVEDLYPFKIEVVKKV